MDAVMTGSVIGGILALAMASLKLAEHAIAKRNGKANAASTPDPCTTCRERVTELSINFGNAMEHLTKATEKQAEETGRIVAFLLKYEDRIATLCAGRAPGCGDTGSHPSVRP
jgi:hypothetical protein